MKRVYIIIFLFVSTNIHAAIPKNTISQEQKNLYEALRLPRKNRLMTLRGQHQVFDKLHEIALNEKLNLKLRWRAITTMGELSPVESKPYLENFSSKQWFLRNAAMIAISHADRPSAIKWAEKMLNDSSLMVRTSAVQTIKKIRGIELQDRLWEKLNHNQNFHRGKSLWIRKHIADVLAEFAIKGEEKEILKDIIGSRCKASSLCFKSFA